MKPSARLVTSLAILCLAGESLGIGLPSLLSGFITPTKNDAEEEHVEIKDQDETLTDESESEKRPPLIPAIPHPADTNLNPNNNPNHPLHPGNLPHLPQLPHLPHFTRETIHATKTVFVEVTDRVTIHPVCMTVHKVTPPCLPYNPHPGGHGSYYHHHRDDVPEELQPQGPSPAAGVKVPQIQPTKVATLVEPTKADHHPKYLQVLESHRYVGRESVSNSRSDETALESTEESSLEDSDRNARYVEFTPQLNPSEEVQIKDEPTEYSSFTPLHMMHHLLHRRPVTHYKTKTLWVTKVEKVLDTRVTATLLVKNCVPTNSHIPICSPHHGVFGPGYHGQLGQNGHHTYTENVHGHFGHSGSFTEKAEAWGPEGEVFEQRADESFSDEESQKEAAGEGDIEIA